MLLWREDLRGPVGGVTLRALGLSYAETVPGMQNLRSFFHEFPVTYIHCIYFRSPIRRLAEAASASGQRLLSLAASINEKYSINNIKTGNFIFCKTIQYFAELSEKYLAVSFELFRATKDISNQAIVMCNISSLLRFRASAVQSHGNCAELEMRSTVSVREVNNAMKLVDRNAVTSLGVENPSSLLQRAIEICNSAHSLLGQRGCIEGSENGRHSDIMQNERVWDDVSHELGCAYLAVGSNRTIVVHVFSLDCNSITIL